MHVKDPRLHLERLTQKKIDCKKYENQIQRFFKKKQEGFIKLNITLNTISVFNQVYIFYD